MTDWSSYQFQDFIPYTPEVYMRLVERIGESYWPLHLGFVALAMAAIYAATQKRTRLAMCLLAPAWLFVGIAYFALRYSELSWVGGYIAGGFVVQSALLVLLSLSRSTASLTSLDDPTNHLSRGKVKTRMGFILAVAGLFAYPLIAPLSGFSWYQAETFGLHPMPTAIVTLGLVLMLFNGASMWLALVIPCLWLVFSGLYLWVLELPWASGHVLVLLWVLVAIVSQVLSKKNGH